MATILLKRKDVIVGRKREQKLLEKAYKSKEAEFITLYGRRRVGKTFLIREFFGNKKCIFFHVTGVQNGTLEQQLKKFSSVVSQTFLIDEDLETPRNWNDAFSLLQRQAAKTKGKVVIFLDELPWLATKKSYLLSELDYFWNRHWSGMRNIILIVCGSSASWLIQKIIYNKGGLHNRTTCRIPLQPFNLHETDLYLKSKGMKLNQKQVLSLYMALGGIPYYLNYVEAGLSAEQNIQNLMFQKHSLMNDEYSVLFDSLFENADSYREIIEQIAQKREGIERRELDALPTITKSGGRLSQRLKDLVSTGFIEEFTPWGRARGEYYKIVDEYTIFYLHWVQTKAKKVTSDFWIMQSQRPAYYAWAGYAFEAICMKHVEQIIKALKIPAKEVGSWRYVSPRKAPDYGAQVDLVIDRWDSALNLCEIKYTAQPFILDKKCAEKLKKTTELFRKRTKTDKQIILSLVSASGVKKTIYLEDMINGTVTLKDLFVQL